MNIQEYVDSEVAKGNTDIYIPEGLDPMVNALEMPAGIRITFPWVSFADLKQHIEQKKCDNCKGAGHLRVRPYAEPLKVDGQGLLIPPALPRAHSSVKLCDVCNGTGKEL